MDEVAMIGAHRTTKGVIVVEVCSEAEGKHRGVAEAFSNYTRVIALRLLIHTLLIFRTMFGHDNG
jgi:hypothetical protein